MLVQFFVAQSCLGVFVLVSRVLVELHCFYELSRKKREAYHEFKGVDEEGKLIKGKSFRVKNPFYNPKPRPKWCKKLNPGLATSAYCLGVEGCSEKCPHLMVSRLTLAEEIVAFSALNGFESTLDDEAFDGFCKADALERNAERKLVLDAEGFEERNGFVVRKGSKRDPAAERLRAMGFKKG